MSICTVSKIPNSSWVHIFLSNGGYRPLRRSGSELLSNLVKVLPQMCLLTIWGFNC